MIRLLWWTLLVIAVLLLGGVLAQMMLADSGVVMVAWNGWLIEMTFWTAIGMVLLVFLTLFVAQQIWRVSAPTRLWQKLRNRRDQKAAKKETVIAFNAWLAGQDDRAILALQRVAQAGGSDRLPRAMTLAVGWQQGDWYERQAELLQQDPELKPFVFAIAAERYWQQGKQADFLELLEQQPDLQQVAWLRERYWLALLSQGKALSLLEKVNSCSFIEPGQRLQWLEKAAVEALANNSHGPTTLKQVLKQIPKDVKQSQVFALAQIEYESALGHGESAWKQAKQFAQRWGVEALLPIWPCFKVSAQQQLELLEQYEIATPTAHYCRITGQVNLELQLWGQAQSWLEKAWAAHDVEAGLALAVLFEQRNMPDQANRVYKQMAQWQLEKLPHG